MAAARAALQELLGALGESTQFVVSASLPAVLPGLEVKGVGPVGTPISAADAKRLIAKAEQAPYGRGEQTIVDTEVRRVWQIEPSDVSLENDEWEGHVAAMVDAVRKDFGIAQRVKAELYKLLIYEKGSFFAPHRDTEKSRNMFATLAVCLPSRHEGGALVVQHDGRTRRIEFGGKNSQFKTQYAAFYADCQHEIEPVTAGHRICLIYNLATAGKRQPAAPENASAVAQAAELLSALFAEPTGPGNKIAIPFTHQYTEAGLDPAQLKGADRARADVLLRAAESLDYACYLALLTHWQSGSPDYSTMGYDPYRRRSSYAWSEDDEEDDDDDSSDAKVEMEEVFDEQLSLDHWLDPAGRTQDFGEIQLDDREILTLGSREGWAQRQEIQEATGNAGASMERWYRQGAVVVWPRDRTFRILAGEGQQAALPELLRMIGRSKSADALAACRKFAAEIVNHWQPRQTNDSQRGYSREMLEILGKIDAGELAERFVRDVLPRDFDGSEGDVLRRLCERRGWPVLGPALRALIDKQMPRDYFVRLLPIVSLCRPLCCEELPLVGDRRSVCLDLAEALARAIERWDREPVIDYGAEDFDDEPDNSRAGVVADAIHIFATVDSGKRLDQFLARVLCDKRRYRLHQVLIPDCKALHERLPDAPQVRDAASGLREHCRAELQAATARPVEPPQDWAREADLDCRCEDCQALAKFLRDPAAKVGRFSVRQDRRQHLHQQIDHNRCDCTHVTERKGSPQTLVCTKTQASYQRRLQQFHLDQKFLAELDALATTPQGTAVPPPKTKRASKRRVSGRPAS